MDSCDLLMNMFRLVLTCTMTSYMYVALPVSDTGSTPCTKLEFCLDILPYNMTIFPNILSHTRQEEAIEIYNQISPLIKTGCSKDLHHFICFSLVPPCTILPDFIPVCKSFCQRAVTKECLDILDNMQISVPQVLECGSLPTNRLCIGENQTSIAGSGAAISPTRATSPWHPGDNSYEQVDSDIKIDLYFLAKTGSNIQLLQIRSPNDMDTLTLYRRMEGNTGSALDYYLPEKYVFWASPLENRIYRGRFIVEALREIVPIVDTGSSIVESLVVDWNLVVLFWSETVPVARIRTASLSGRGVKTVVSEKMMYPISLTVDPTEGLLFWIDRRGDEFFSYSTIESFSVVTNDRRFVFNITSEGSRPRSLVADIEGKKLFWVDARSESLHSINYDGSDHMVLLENHKYLQEPDNLVVSGTKLIWVDKYSKSLIWANKEDAVDLMRIKTFDTYPPQTLRLYGKSMQVNTTSYNKAMLAEEWQELSSREILDVPDLDEYGFRDNYDGYGDDDDDDKSKRKDKKKNNGQIARTNRFLSLICLVLIVANKHLQK